APAPAAAPPTDALADRRTPVVRAVERAAPGVVNISTTQVVVQQFSPLLGMDLPDVFKREFGDLFRPQRYVKNSLGSGVIISPRGYIVTNAHVVQQADQIIVTLADESQKKAELVSADPAADLAVIKIDSDKPLAAIPMGTSSDLMIGETVIAVGNPFGYQHTVTTGVVSALGRTIQPSPNFQYEGLIQTDAPINPGNSGGPLLNIRGELVGINTAIRAGAQGLGFAIPVDRVREIMIGLLCMRRPGAAWLGLHFRADCPGAVVASVDRGSPAAKAGLTANDRIVSVAGEAVEDAIQLETFILDRKPGDSIRLGVGRGETAHEMEIVLVEAPKPDGARLAKTLFGLDLQALAPDLAATMRLAVDRGLLVAGVEPDSPAAATGLRAGDVIVQVDRYRVADIETLGALLVQVKKGNRILFFVVRGQSVMQAALAARAGTDGPEDARKP
ncbi:MAG: trypsin-like peptidase domain-containing protein, partial [Planctomycetota bacterium]|nr:trypsin-like peptidase domain-containing protein [Planctomycetota bacterium]